MKFKRYLGIKFIGEKDTDRLMHNARISYLKSIIYKAGSQFLIDPGFPLHLYLELSRTCNYKCPMCIRSESPSGGHFPESLAEKIISEAAKKGPTSYSLHLFGEPLANPKWDNIVEMIRSVNPRNAILLTTNGFFMNEPNCRKLIDLKVNRIFVSMHSFDPQTYEKNTGGADISIIFENIRAFLKTAGKESKTKLFVRLFYGPGQTLKEGEEEKMKELRSQGVLFEIRGYHNYAGTRNEWTTFSRFIERWPCFHPWFTLGITVDGKATICCTDGRLGLCVGDAFSQSIEDIWKSEAVKSIREEHLKNKFEKWSTCAICDTWQFHPDIFFTWQKLKKNKI